MPTFASANMIVAAEADVEGDAGDRGVRLLDEEAREREATSDGHVEGRCTDVRSKEASELAFADVEFACEILHRAAVEEAVLDQSQRLRDDRRATRPGRATRGGLRVAAAAGPKAGRGGRRCVREETDVLALRHGCRADRAAAHARASHRDEEAAVEAWVAALGRPVEHLEVHGAEP
jgi:hypothetical protein